MKNNTLPVIQLKITLCGTNPAVWRRILIPESITFSDLHHVIQISMGWTNSHYFEFTVGDYEIGYLNEKFDQSESLADANRVTADTLLTKKGMQFAYLYDFGDHWEHTVEVEKFMPGDTGQVYPVCLEGSLNCPPEDCGGIPGYYNLLEILKDKKHPEYSEMKTWVGRGYNPEKFDLEKINKMLPKFKKYLKDWEE